MQTASLDFLAELAADPANGFSIGAFGAIGEFMRDPDEPVAIRRMAERMEVVTARGALRIQADGPLPVAAWDTLSSDGETWGHALAVCVDQPPASARTICDLGLDQDAIRPEDRGERLHDLGVGVGAVRMCLRTGDPQLIAALQAAEGQPLLGRPEVHKQVMRAQPHRVLISPAGRIEVFQPIPPPDGKSPEGPHTHLLPKLIATAKPHSANVPLPDGVQSALNVHPRSPWRTPAGEQRRFDAEIDAAFLPLLHRFGSDQDADIRQAITEAVQRNAEPDPSAWPETRRGRVVARIVLRRLAAAGEHRAEPWRRLYDHASGDGES
jgi:hypothetical protein